MGDDPLFETRVASGRRAYKVFATSMLASICLAWAYRAAHMPCNSTITNNGGAEQHESWWVWIGLFVAELWFGFLWIVTQSTRWNPIFNTTFKDRLSQRYKEDELPNVDIFVCTADPTIEPPSLVMSTVLSVMAYDYPSTKLSVYLSDDGGSHLTFYALLEASNFAKHWLPFCRKYKIEPPSPHAYFNVHGRPVEDSMGDEFLNIKGLFLEMVERIDEAVKLGRVPDEMKQLHKGFQEWTPSVKRQDHQSIVQLVIDGREGGDHDEATEEASDLPTLVYLSREKRPHHDHHFKAGAMNALFGLKYNCAVEDVITGLSIQCKGWRSVYFNPIQKGFSGLAPVTLAQALVQHQRWSEGHLQIFLSKYCPFLYGNSKIKMGLQLTYYYYSWALGSIPTLFYIIIPPLLLFRGMTVYPKVSSLWFLPFAYIIIARNLYSLGESLLSDDTLAAWWNLQRMYLLRKITSYLFATIDVIMGRLGLSKKKFVITSKVADDEILERYKAEVIDFSAMPPVFSTIIATTALFNLFCFIGGIKQVAFDKMIPAERLFLQFCLSGVVVLLNQPTYNAMFFRRDTGSIPMGIGLISLFFAASGLTLPVI